MSQNPYGADVPGNDAFVAHRESHRQAMGHDANLRRKAIELQMDAETYGFGYQHEWCGVPIIRLPDDIVLLQEIIWHVRPAFIVETGVARGGSLVLSASLMAMTGVEPHVLGLDLLVLPHATAALSESPFADGIEVWEGDSTSSEAAAAVRAFISAHAPSGPGILVLDSDHSHDHVLRELEKLCPMFPEGSVIVVADTLIEDMPMGHYPDRPWDVGNNPLTALRQFLAANPDYVPSQRWGRRGLMTELRDGVIEKVGVNVDDS